MRMICDTVDDPKRFPFDTLVARLLEVFGFRPNDAVRVTRITGLGVGGIVQRYEAVLNEEGQLAVSFRDLCVCVQSEGEVIDWLYCVHNKVGFGIVDSSCMFVQAEDKHLEEEVARSFAQVKEVPDHDLG